MVALARLMPLRGLRLAPDVNTSSSSSSSGTVNTACFESLLISENSLDALGTSGRVKLGCHKQHDWQLGHKIKIRVDPLATAQNSVAQ